MNGRLTAIREFSLGFRYLRTASFQGVEATEHVSGDGMRIFLVLLVIAIGGAAWWWFDRDPEAERARLIEKAQFAAAEIGVRRMLAQSGPFEFSDVVIGPRLEDGGWDFRGLLRRDGDFRPTYGRAAPVCESSLEAAECWEISYLEADGKEVPLGVETEAPEAVSGLPGSEADLPLTPAAPDTPPIASPEGPPPDADEASGAPTPAAEETTEAAVAEPTPAVGPQVPTEPAVAPAPSPEAEAPQATHRVARARVNIRAGPGIGNPVVTTLSAGTLLTLIETEGNWGRFLILDGEATGTEAWAALSIVEDIRP